MKIRARRIVLPVWLCGLLLVPGEVQAERLFTPAVFDSVPSREGGQNAAPQPKRSSGRAVATGAVIGAGTALVVTGLAASRYGDNESGGFCSICMVQWSVVTVPVGAAIGAGIGYGIGRARRSVTAVPILSRKAAGIVIAARF